MKKWFALLLTAVLCLSLAVALLSAAVLHLSLAVSGGKNDASVSSDASANSVVDRKDGASASSNAPANTVANEKDDASVSSDMPANIVVDGKEIPVKDFLIAYLSNYIQSDAYLARTAKFEQAVDRKAQPFAVKFAFKMHRLSSLNFVSIPSTFTLSGTLAISLNNCVIVFSASAATFEALLQEANERTIRRRKNNLFINQHFTIYVKVTNFP